jgi:diadenosine tetraphosphate (Ap4A) HIT family hydrolase
MLIVESENFRLESNDEPDVGRLDGGHLVILPKLPVEDRTKLSPAQVKELALLTNVAGMSMRDALSEQGIELGRINYQDNGDWKPEMQMHLYGRAVDATYQTYGEPVKLPRTEEEKVVQEPLTEEDCELIRKRALLYAAAPGYEELHLTEPGKK